MSAGGLADAGTRAGSPVTGAALGGPRLTSGHLPTGGCMDLHGAHGHIPG